MREQRAPQFCTVVGRGTRTYMLLPPKEGLSKSVKQSGPRVTPARLITDFQFLIPHISSSGPSNLLRPQKCGSSSAPTPKPFLSHHSALPPCYTSSEPI